MSKMNVPEFQSIITGAYEQAKKDRAASVARGESEREQEFAFEAGLTASATALAIAADLVKVSTT